MPRLVSTLALKSIVLLSLLSLSLASAHAANRATRTPGQGAASFRSWMSGVLPPPPSFAPSSPDNWLGGMGNCNGADWSAGEPGSDVFIATGNDNVTLDVNSSINSLTLGGTTGSSMLTNSGNSSLTIAGALTINQSGTLTLNGGSATAGGAIMNAGTVNLSDGGTIQGATVANSGTINLNVAFVGATGTLTNSGNINGGEDTVDSVSGGTVINSGNITVFSVGSSGNFTNQAGATVNAFALGVGGNLINQGTVQGLMPGSQLTVTGELTNSGRFDTSYSGATVGSLNNLAGGLIYDADEMAVNGNASNSGAIVVASYGPGNPPAVLTIRGNLTNSGSVSVSSNEGGEDAGVGNVVNSG